MLNTKLDKLIAGRERKTFAAQVISTIAKEIIRSADDIINIDDPDLRREAWGEFLDEIGIPWEEMMK